MKQEEEYLRRLLERAEEKERSFQTAGVLMEREPSPDFFLVFENIFRRAGISGLLTGMGDVLCLAFTVTVLCFFGVWVFLGQDREQLSAAVFISAPVLYAGLFGFSWLKEVQNRTYQLQMSFRWTFFDILAVRMFLNSLLGIAVNGIYAVVLAFRCAADGIRVFAMSFTSLMLFSLILMLGITKGKKVLKGVAAGGGWMLLHAVLAAVDGERYRRILDTVPFWVLAAAGTAALVFYLRELGSLLSVRFRKEYTDAEC